jgi:hypothetical protein
MVKWIEFGLIRGGLSEQRRTIAVVWARILDEAIRLSVKVRDGWENE